MNRWTVERLDDANEWVLYERGSTEIRASFRDRSLANRVVAILNLHDIDTQGCKDVR